MRGPKQLLENEDRLVTRMGAWFPGERVVFRGKDLHVDLGNLTWMDLYLYSVTGRRFKESELRVLNAIWTYTSFPDPRLWNNRIAALAGTTRSTGVLGISAATAVSEASIYGRRPDIRSIDFLLRAQKRRAQGTELATLVKEELRKHRGIYGYGRPLIREDERIPHLLRLAAEEGLHDGPYVQLAFDVEQILLTGRWRLHMNYAGLAAGLCADLGFTPRTFYLFLIPVFVAGMLPCFIEASEKSEGAFLPLSCSRIAYEGPHRRDWD